MWEKSMTATGKPYCAITNQHLALSAKRTGTQRFIVVVHCRDHKGVGVAHKIISPKNQLQFSQTIMGSIKLRFSLTWNTFQKLLLDLKWNFLLSVWPSDSMNFSLLDAASAQKVPFGIPQYVQCILYGLTSVLLCVPFIFVGSEQCRFSGCTWWLPLHNWNLDYNPHPWPSEVYCLINPPPSAQWWTFWTLVAYMWNTTPRSHDLCIIPTWGEYI